MPSCACCGCGCGTGLVGLAVVLGLWRWVAADRLRLIRGDNDG